MKEFGTPAEAPFGLSIKAIISEKARSSVEETGTGGLFEPDLDSRSFWHVFVCAVCAESVVAKALSGDGWCQ